MQYERLTNRDNAEMLKCGSDNFALLYTRLAELEDKIENGTLVELPCKVGDTAYGIWKDEEGEYYIRSDEVDIIAVCKDSFSLCDIEGNELNDEYNDKYVCLFFTKEEDEAKLKELKNERTY